MLPREIRPGTTYLLTRRCAGRRFLLRPSQKVNHLVEYCLAVAAARTGVQIHAFCAMSNHVHSVVTDVEGRLPEFLQLFHRNVAVSLNSLLEREENFWAVGAASVVELGDHNDILDKIAYVLANPTSAGLVDAPKKWPGILRGLKHESIQLRRPSTFFRLNGPMPERVSITYTLPTQLMWRTEQEVRTAIAVHVAQKVSIARARFQALGKQFRGRRGVLNASPNEQGKTNESKGARSPRFAIANKALRLAALTRWRAFIAAYKEALQKWRSGERACRFPEGTWLMRQMHHVHCDAPLHRAA